MVGISGEEFLARRDAGEVRDFEDTPDGRELAYLSSSSPLAGASPEEAVDAFLARVRTTLSCIASATAYAGHAIPGHPRSPTLNAAGQSEPGRVLLMG
jgi:hypothetical protein